MKSIMKFVRKLGIGVRYYHMTLGVADNTGFMNFMQTVRVEGPVNWIELAKESFDALPAKNRIQFKDGREKVVITNVFKITKKDFEKYKPGIME